MIESDTVLGLLTCDKELQFETICENILYRPEACEVSVDGAQLLRLIADYLEWLNKGAFAEEHTWYDVDWADLVIAVYWVGADYHTGQTSELYRLHCLASEQYTPGRLARGISRSEDFGAWQLYRELRMIALADR